MLMFYSHIVSKFLLMRLACLITFIVALLLMPMSSQAKTVDVLAIEYPPFMTSEEPNNGIAFELLEKAAFSDAITWRALFVPPARAAAIIRSGEWCASFYPAVEGIESQSIVLSKSKISVGLVRLAEKSTFVWQSLNDLAGESVALLRTKEDAAFAQQFTDAGFRIVFVEDIETGIRLVKSNRVDYALSDNMSFAQLNDDALQFSKSALVVTPVTLYLNPVCDIFGPLD